MNAAQLHLMTAHLPVLGVPFSLALLLSGLLWRSETLWRAGCWAVLLSAAFAAFPYFSGPSAYELVAKTFNVESEPVETHAVVARATSLGLVLLAALTMSSLLRDWQGDPPGKPLKITIVVGALLAAYALAWSAHLGGTIRHPELDRPPLRVFPSLTD